jgi:uncharacterized membrane-anchored protein YhcB (DUF1043 family)
VTISHEKLIDAWPWLKKLVNENRDVIALQNEIAADAKEWEEHKRDASYLYVGGRLANIREQIERKKLTINHPAQEFVQASLARQKRGQVVVIGGTSTIVIFLIIVIIAVLQTRQSQRSSEQANMASNMSASNEILLYQQRDAAIANQLATQAQLIDALGNSEQTTAILLAVQSMKTFPNNDAEQILQDNLKGQIDTNRMQEWGSDELIANTCSRASRNLTRPEWEQYIGEALPYQAICENLPIEPEPTPTANP